MAWVLESAESTFPDFDIFFAKHLFFVFVPKF